MAGGSDIATQMWSGTDLPAQWYPHSSTHRDNSATEVTEAS
jgi:hypothetical protein